MELIKRSLLAKIAKKLDTDSAIILFGARQVGKTTLLNELVQKIDNFLWFNADDIIDIRKLNNMIEYHPEILLDYKYLIIDEAQLLENVGVKLKVLHDKYKDKGLQIIATGSSSFDLANKINEPMTGRKWEFQMFPFMFSELVEHHGLEEERKLLKKRLIYGSYPRAVFSPGDEKDVLFSLANSTLYKDILKWSNLYKSNKIADLTKTLAHQIGSTVNYSEIAAHIKLDRKTVEKYITLLEQTFIIFRLSSFSRNLRNEIKRFDKIYFYDNGIRNAVISNFNQVDSRTDVGGLFENYFISEMMKKKQYQNYYFWRDRKQREIDLVEEHNGQIKTYEIKWSSNRSPQTPKFFLEKYLPVSSDFVNSENYYRFLK
ncbi:MAG: ATP-binding protein [Bifidobacteriaceae bacterium]|nr:ATP-binding protein [Bifidobacteriaceae bacterium]